MTNKIHHQLIIPDALAGQRLDQALVQLLPEYSRTQIQTWLTQGEIILNGKTPKAKTIVTGGESVIIEALPKIQPSWVAQEIPLDIIYEDDHILVVNKPAGMVVHPAAGNYENTLLNAIIHHAPALKQLPRAGIVHRLDKDTSGLLVIAKTEMALKSLSKQLKKHDIIRIYQAIISGILVSGGTVNEPIGRHPIQRLKMTITEMGKPATTHYRVMERYRAHTRIKVQLETGRTHQIRVHMAHIHHPLLGDPIYGGRLQLPKKATPALITALRQFKRQALHAEELEFIHPVSKKQIKCSAPLPEDLQQLIQVLKKDAKNAEQ